MLTVEFRFILDGRELSMERVANTIGIEIAKALSPNVGGWNTPPVGLNHEPIPHSQFDKRAYSPKEAAKILGISEAAVRRYITFQAIPFVRFGRLVRITRETIEKVMKDGRPDARLKRIV
ncbi:MAG: helix-turn-helix domain-containing protein [Terriglobia bacterium]